MATSAQITANRINAQASTGPRSVQGKAASSRNSLKLGLYAKTIIIAGEDPAALESLAAGYLEHFAPVGPVEADLVQDIIRSAWMKRRFERLEAEVFASRIANLTEDTPHLLGAAMIHDANNGDTINKIYRRIAAAQREWYKAIDALTRLQVLRRRAEAEAEAEADAETETPDLAALLHDPELDALIENRVRFDAPPVPRVTAPPVNLALRL